LTATIKVIVAEALTEVTLELSTDTACPGDSIVATGTADANNWVSIKVLDEAGNVVFFDATRADAEGNYSLTFKVPYVAPGTLTVVAGYGDNVATKELEVKVEVVRADGDVTQDAGFTGGKSLEYDFVADGKKLTIDANNTKLPYENDMLGRSIGEPLWPERFGLDELLMIKAAVGSYVWNALYQQRPSPIEGGMLKRGWWQFYKELPSKFDEIIQSWDMTFKDSAGTRLCCWTSVGAQRGRQVFA